MILSEKVAIVTGAGQGIGRDICKKLSDAGAKIILNDIDPQLAVKTARAIAGPGGGCLAVPGDSGDLKTIRRMVDLAVSEFGQLDIVVANAGITLFGDFFTYTPEDFSRVMEVNLAGSFFLAQAAASQMKQQGRGGSLLFMSSVTGHQAHKHLAAYSMSKAALEMLARNLVVEISAFGINVNCIAPGATATERTLEDKDYETTWSRITPMGRPARAEDIANTALFLVSAEARHITGQTIIVDGGWSSVSPSPY